MRKILIAGAGPGGLVAATKLARAGVEVTLLSPKLDGPKVGECVPGAILRLLTKLNLPTDDFNESVHVEIGGAMSLWAGESRHQDFISHPEGCSWRLNRRAFEQSLEKTAIAAGVQRQLGRMLHADFDSDHRWRFRADTGFSATVDFVIDATGRRAVFARQQNVTRRSGPPLVALWAIGDSERQSPTNRTLVESVADGWWYGAHLPGGSPIAIFHTSAELATTLNRAPEDWRKRLASTNLIAEHISPTAFDQRPLRASDARSSHLDRPFGKHWAACGDGALSFDPVSSQGIFNALSTGDMVASALLDHNTDQALQKYHQQLIDIRRINARRREALYESALLHYKAPFWEEQLAVTVHPLGKGTFM